MFIFSCRMPKAQPTWTSIYNSISYLRFLEPPIQFEFGLQIYVMPFRCMTSWVRVFPFHSESRAQTANVLCYPLGLFSTPSLFWGNGSLSPDFMQVGIVRVSCQTFQFRQTNWAFLLGLFSFFPVSYSQTNQWSSSPNLTKPARGQSIFTQFVAPHVFVPPLPLPVHKCLLKYF